MKIRLKKIFSQELFEASLLRSLKIITKQAKNTSNSKKKISKNHSIKNSLKTYSPPPTITIKTTRENSLQTNTLSRTPSEFLESFDLLGNCKNVKFQNSHKKIHFQEEFRQKFEILEKKSEKVQNQEKLIKDLEQQIHKKNKELAKKQRELEIQQLGSDKIIEGVIVSSIINYII